MDIARIVEESFQELEAELNHMLQDLDRKSVV